MRVVKWGADFFQVFINDWTGEPQWSGGESGAAAARLTGLGDFILALWFGLSFLT